MLLRPARRLLGNRKIFVGFEDLVVFLQILTGKVPIQREELEKIIREESRLSILPRLRILVYGF
jgi:hypothetical protein